MAAITAFPIIPDTMHGAFGTEIEYEAVSDVLGGQVVKVSSGKIAPATAATDAIVGVALYDIPAGTVGAVRVVGVVRCANATDGTAIAAGALVTASTLGGIAAASTGKVLGVALEAIAGNGTGLVAIGVSLCPAS